MYFSVCSVVRAATYRNHLISNGYTKIPMTKIIAFSEERYKDASLFLAVSQSI